MNSTVFWSECRDSVHYGVAAVETGVNRVSAGHSNFIIRISALKKKIQNSKCCSGFFGPSVEIRTRGLLNPIQARYQTSPHPDMQFAVRQLCYITTPFSNLQALISNFSKNFFAGGGFRLDNGGWIWYSISCVWD